MFDGIARRSQREKICPIAGCEGDIAYRYQARDSGIGRDGECL